MVQVTTSLTRAGTISERPKANRFKRSPQDHPKAFGFRLPAASGAPPFWTSYQKAQEF